MKFSKKQSAFKIFLIGSAFFSLASSIYALVIPLIVYDITKSPAKMGLVRGVEYLPHVFFAIVLGLFFDRVNRKTWAVRFLFIQACIVIGLYCALRWMSLDPMYFIVPSTFAVMLLSYAFFNASFGIQKKILTSEEQDITISRLATVNTFLDVIGPALSGYLIFLTSLNISLLIVGFLFLMACFFLNRVVYQHESVEQQSLIEQLVAVVRCFLSQKLLVIMTILAAVVNGSASAMEIQLVYTLKSSLQLSASEVGVVMAMLGVGGIAGSLGARKLMHRIGKSRLLLVSVFFIGANQILASFVSSFVAFSMLNILLGIALMTVNISVWTYRQEVTPHQLMGRMAGLTGSLFKILMPVSLMGSGFLIQVWGYQKLFFVLGLTTLASVLVGLYLKKRWLAPFEQKA